MFFCFCPYRYRFGDNCIHKQYTINKTTIMGKNKINLGWIVRGMAPIVFNGIEFAISNIKHPAARKGLELAIKHTKNAVDLLTDGEPDNAKQFADYYRENWRELAENTLEVVECYLEEKSPDTAKDVAKIKKRISEM